MDDKHSHPKLNLFALPAQTGMMVVMITLVMLGTLLAIGANAQPAVYLTLAGILIILSLRGLLAWPGHEIARQRLMPATPPFAPLQDYIQALASRLDLPRVPRLMLAPGDIGLYTFGSWRRWYIVMGEKQAETALTMIDDPCIRHDLEAALLHELYHFKNGDNIALEYARALLHNGFWMIAWATGLLFGILIFTIMASHMLFETYSLELVIQYFAVVFPAEIVPIIFPSVEEWQQIREQASRTSMGQALYNVLVNTLPFILLGGLLLNIFWQRLMRIREIYADAGVAHTQGKVAPLLRTIVRFQSATSLASTDEHLLLHQRLLAGLQIRIKKLNNRFFQYHLDSSKRLEYLCKPHVICGSWWSDGRLIGLFVLALNLMLLGTSALYYAARWPMHFPVLAAYILISLVLLVPLVLGRSLWIESIKITGLVILFHTIVLLASLSILGLGLLLDPTELGRFIDAFASAVVGYAGLPDTSLPEDITAFVIQTVVVNLSQVPVMFLAILTNVWFSLWTSRRMLTWYALPNAEQRLMRLVYLVIGLLALVLAFVVLPPITDLVVWRPVSLFSPIYWLISVPILLLTVVIGVWLWWLDRHYAQRCPNCDKVLAGHYALGNKCESCDEVLYPWLLATYDTYDTEVTP